MTSMATISIRSGDKAVEVCRADLSARPVKPLGPIVEIPAHTSINFIVNEVQGLVIREKPGA